MGSFERWNTHLETLVEQEVMGIIISLAQDPSSMNLGTSVWDASIVLAKYLELVRLCRRPDGQGEGAVLALAHLPCSPTCGAERSQGRLCQVQGRPLPPGKINGRHRAI